MIILIQKGNNLRQIITESGVANIEDILLKTSEDLKKGIETEEEDEEFETSEETDFPDDQHETTENTVVSENPEEYMIEISIPGFKKEDFLVEVSDDGVLSVNAEMERESIEEGGFGNVFEGIDSSFNQSFKLPEDADKHYIEASYENGFLTLLVGKKTSIQLSDELV